MISLKADSAVTDGAMTGGSAVGACCGSIFFEIEKNCGTWKKIDVITSKTEVKVN